MGVAGAYSKQARLSWQRAHRRHRLLMRRLTWTGHRAASCFAACRSSASLPGPANSRGTSAASLSKQQERRLELESFTWGLIDVEDGYNE